MKNIFLLALLFAASLNCHADEWTDTDTHIELTYMAFHLADWGQTKSGASHADQYMELNAILGKHPSPGRVDAYFAITALAHYYIAAALPPAYRRIFQHVTIGYEASTVSRNYRGGVGFSF